MSRRTPPSTDKPLTVDGDEWSILRDMLPYLWPAGRPDLRKRFADIGLEAKSSTPEAFAAFIKAEHARWKTIAKAANIQIN